MLTFIFFQTPQGLNLQQEAKFKFISPGMIYRLRLAAVGAELIIIIQ